jgi:acetyl esterase/lipase
MERRRAVLTLLSIFAHACQSATAQDDSKRSSPVFKSNVEYAKVGGKSLRLDAYLPAGKLPAPAIVLLHGGGFTSGVKGGYTGELARHLFTQGYAAFDIDYRLMGDPGLGATLPKAMLAAREDLARAVEHVLANSKSYGIDPDRLAVSGGSAGAITALLATYGEDRLTQRPGAVVSLWGGMYGQERAIKPGDPPVLQVHGTADKTVPFAHSESIATTSRKAGVDAVLLRIENGGHPLPLNKPFKGQTILQSVTEFLDTRLK